MGAGEPPDLRLAGFTLGVWLSALAALHLSAWSGVTLAVAGLILAALLVAVRPAGRERVAAGSSSGAGRRSPVVTSAAGELRLPRGLSSAPPGGPRPANALAPEAGPQRAEPQRAEPQRAGAEPQQAGPQQAGPQQAGTQRAEPQRAGVQRAGAQRAGRPRSGASLSRMGERLADLLPWVVVRWICVAAALGVGCGAVATAARVSVREADALVALVAAGQPVLVEIVVRDDPRLLPRSAGPPTYLVAVELRSVQADEAAPVRLSARALVLGADPGWRGLLPGQRVTATGKLMPPRPGDLRAAVITVRKPPVLVGQPSWAQRGAGVLRAGLQRACEPLPDDSGGLLPGLVVGDTSRLDLALEEDFRTTGMTHLTAVSGTNVAIVLGVVLFLVRRARAGPVLCAGICAVALVGFVILARPSPSVVRAGAMGAVGLIGLATGRPRAAVPALAAAAAVLLVADPELAADPGFALSVLATSGLLLLAPGWRDGLRRRGWPPGVAEALAVPAAAQLACGPVVAAISGTVSLVSVPANLLAVPAIAPATLLGVVAAVVSPVWPAGAEFLAWLGHWPTEWLVLVAHTGARVPAGAVPWPGGAAGGLMLAALTVAFLVAARRPAVRRLAAVAAAATMLGAMPVRLVAPGWPPPGWLVIACAVGQGDAVVLPAGKGRAVVVDAGPEPNAVDHCLRRLRIRQVVLLAVSHFHADHIGGVDGVFRGRTVTAVIGPDWPEPVGGRAAVERAAGKARTPMALVGPGWSFTAGDLRLDVLGPIDPMRGTNSDPNNNSLILRAVIDGRTVLLPGDAETEEQDDLVARLGETALRADVLKVAHHGSALQAPALLDAVDPAVALVSVGRDNDYGHPNGAVLARLARGGARILRTDESGDIAAVAAEDGLAVAARGDPPPK